MRRRRRAMKRRGTVDNPFAVGDVVELISAGSPNGKGHSEGTFGVVEDIHHDGGCGGYIRRVLYTVEFVMGKTTTRKVLLPQRLRAVEEMNAEEWKKKLEATRRGSREKSGIYYLEWSDQDRVWTARHSMYKSLATHGDTPVEALSELVPLVAETEKEK
jgi:hypothetical protein